MCGIWAIIGKNKAGLLQKDVSMASQMMRFTAPRGDQSTGIAITDYKKPEKRPKIWKVLGGPDFLIQNKAWADIDKAIFEMGGAVFGHGRWATKGNITAKNAHPFIHKHISLVHNGTLHSGLDYEKEEGEKDVEVDSHALCIKIAQKGIEEALTEAAGAYAIIVHDQQTKTLWFGRNSERTLFMAETSERVFLMSEEHALKAVLARNYINTPITSVMTDWLHKFDLENLTLTKEIDVWKKKYPTSSYYSNNYYQKKAYTNSWDEPRETRRYKPDFGKVQFLVTAVAKDYGEFVYSAETDDRTPVEFRTNQQLDQLIGKIGTCEVAYEIWRGGNMRKFIRFRDIEWEEETKDAEEVTEKVTLLNGKSFKAGTWKHLCKSATCGVCNDFIQEEDAALTVLNDNGSFVCKDCVGNHTNYTLPAHPYAMGDE